MKQLEFKKKILPENVFLKFINSSSEDCVIFCEQLKEDVMIVSANSILINIKDEHTPFGLCIAGTKKTVIPPYTLSWTNPQVTCETT